MAGRILEGVVIVVGIISLLSVDVPVTACSPTHLGDWPGWRPTDLRLVDRGAVRRLRPGFRVGGDRRDPGVVWEMSLAIRLIAKGFNPSALASLAARHADKTRASLPWLPLLANWTC